MPALFEAGRSGFIKTSRPVVRIAGIVVCDDKDSCNVYSLSLWERVGVRDLGG